MNKIILLALVLITLSSDAQVIKLRAKQSASVDFKNKEKIKWNESNFIITINAADKKITLYSEVTDKREFSYYKMIKLPKNTVKNTDTYGSNTLQFKCIDVEGTECNITFAALDKKQSPYNSRLCILYSSFGLMINVNPE